MKKYLLKAICLMALVITSLPIAANDYLKIYFKDGHTERHFMNLVESIYATKYDLEGNLHDDYQMQQIVMQDTTYSYYLADIDSMSFKKVYEEQLKPIIEKAVTSIETLYNQSPTIEDLETHIDEIKRIEGVEDVWREGHEIVVQFRDWYSLYLSYHNNSDFTLDNLEKIVNSLKRMNQIRRVPVREDGKPMKVVIAFQMEMRDDKDSEKKSKALHTLEQEFRKMGFDVDYIPNKETGESLDLEFYQKRMFDYNIVIVSTHGSYVRGKHGFATDEKLPFEFIYYALKEFLSDIEEVGVGYYDGNYLRISEDFIKKYSYSFNDVGPHIVFWGACHTLEGNGTLIHNQKSYPRSNRAVADIYFEKGTDFFLSYNRSTDKCNDAALELFDLMLSGYSLETAYYNLEDGFILELSDEQACLIDLVNEKSKYDKSYFLFETHTVPKTQQEVGDEINKNGKLKLQGITNVIEIEAKWGAKHTKLKYGIRFGKEPDVDQLKEYQYQEYYSDNPHFTGKENFQVEFSTVIDPYPGQTVYYRAFTYDGINYNWGEERSFIVYNPLTLPSNIASLKVGESSTVDITSGSGSYSIEKIEPTGVVTASISENHISIDALTAGTTIITVKDDKSGQTATIEVTVTEGSGPVSYLTCPDDHHPHMIDLGLPSGTLWACCNVDANKPEGIGGYYAWGETAEKTIFDWSNYIHCDGSYSTCHDLGKRIIGTVYDTAREKWGGEWSMPTLVQLSELKDNCSSEWTKKNGIWGRIFKGSNGGSIFLPASGYRDNDMLKNYNEGCYYWSSSLTYYDHEAYCFTPNKGGVITNSADRYNGLCIRPVIPFYLFALSITSPITLHIGKSIEVNVVSGNGSYNVESSDPTIATVEISENTIEIYAHKVGSVTVFATDTKIGKTVTIEVTVMSYFSCTDDKHPHIIDLGLPSGTKWACCNVGASNPEDFGGYYAWGETEVKNKNKYEWNTYTYWTGSAHTCISLGSDICGTEYDVAHVQWGGVWQMPSYDQLKELVSNCSLKWDRINGIFGRMITGPNGKTIFLPAAGENYSTSNFEGRYWLGKQGSLSGGAAYAYIFENNYGSIYEGQSRKTGCSVRPVCK